jgi:hypothetical protein
MLPLHLIPSIIAVLVAAGLAVIARIVLQRRRRRQLEEAIAAGMLLPEQLVALGYGPYVVEQAVPIMWEASLDKKGDGGEDLKTVLVSFLLPPSLYLINTSSNDNVAAICHCNSRPVLVIAYSKLAPHARTNVPPPIPPKSFVYLITASFRHHDARSFTGDIPSLSSNSSRRFERERPAKGGARRSRFRNC